MATAKETAPTTESLLKQILSKLEAIHEAVRPKDATVEAMKGEEAKRASREEDDE